MENPAVRQESRYEPASVIPLKNKHSLLDWLSSENRLIPRETEEDRGVPKEEEDVNELIGEDDGGYEDDSDDMEENEGL